MDVVERFEGLLAAGKDQPLVRYSLGLEYLKRGQHELAIKHLARAVAADPNYSAAWKIYGNALLAAGKSAQAAAAYERGMAVAQAKGDMQAAKEMRVFLRRANKALGST